MPVKRIALAVIGLALGACGAPEHQNPFDPSTPPPLQARATLAGQVALESLGQVPPGLAGVRVSVPGVGVVDSDATGGWLMPNVPPGNYSVITSRAGYEDGAWSGVLVRLDDGNQTVTVPTIRMLAARGDLAGRVVLTEGSATGFVVGGDLSGMVVTLTGTEQPVPAAVTDAAGGYRFASVPVSPAGAAFTVTASKPNFTAASVTATVVARTAVPVADLTLALRVATLQGMAELWDDAGGLGKNGSSAGVAVALSGIAFNGTPFTRATSTDALGAWTLGDLPAGSYDLVATSANRACGAYARASVLAGTAADAGLVKCEDRVAPGPVVLGAPLPPPGAQAGFTSAGSVEVPIVSQAADTTGPPGNLLGYELAMGGAPDWSTATLVPGTPAALTFAPLPANAASTLWVRAVDWTGNAGPASSLQVVHDGLAPPIPSISVSRTLVNATSTSAGLAGSEPDASFFGYQACTEVVAATAVCQPAPTPACAFATAAPSLAVSLAADQKTCLYARGLDRAGNASAAAVVGLVSDLTAPTGPSVSPLYDAPTLTLHADWVEFQITAPATDGPAGGAPWQNVAWIEMDTGTGFTPVCPQAACHPGDTYAPCACGCQDPRLICNGTSLAALRMPLLGGAANRFGVRAVDVAGNVGSGASQEVVTSGIASLIATSGGNEGGPKVRGRTLLYGAGGGGWVIDLGENERHDAGDATCGFGPIAGDYFSFAPLDSRSLVYTDGGNVWLRRAGPTGWCVGDTQTLIGSSGTAGWFIEAVAASVDPATGLLERVAWAVNNSAARAGQIWVREAGPGGKLDDPGAPPPVLVVDRTSFEVTRLQLGGDSLLYRWHPATSFSLFGTYALLQRTAAGWAGEGSPGAVGASPSAIDLSGGTALAAALDYRGALLAWVADDPVQTIHLRQAGPDLVLATADDPSPLTRTYGTALSSMTDGDVAVEGGHLVVVEGNSNSGTTYFDHWSAGPDGAFDTADDSLARVLPASTWRQHPALGSGLSGGVVFSDVMSGGAMDVVAADLSALRWETMSDSAGTIAPRTNGAGTLIFGRSTGHWARAPDGQETVGLTGASYSGVWAVDGPHFVLPGGYDVVLYQADVAGRFFTAGAPAPVTILTGKVGLAFQNASRGVNAGGGHAIVGACDLATGATCTDASVYVIPLAAPRTPVRIDRPVPDGAPAGSAVAAYSFGTGLSATHAAYVCHRAPNFNAVCVREAGADRVYGAGDRTVVLNQFGVGAAFESVTALEVSGRRIALASAGSLWVADAGPDGQFNTADDVGWNLGPTSGTGQGMLALAGDYLAWITSGASGGQQVWVADVVKRTRRQITSHYSEKPFVSVEATGRVIWEDHLFQQGAVFVASP